MLADIESFNTVIGPSSTGWVSGVQRKMAHMMEVKGRNGQIPFDGQLVTIMRHGFVARNTVGKGEKRIPIGSTNAAQWKPAGSIVNGFIQFETSVAAERDPGPVGRPPTRHTTRIR